MIAFVAGRVAGLAPDGAVLEVGGVGLSVQCTPATLAGLRVGEHAQLPTSLVVREDSLTLYGFADGDERSVFELLQTASGVGPRLAQAMLAVHAPDTLRRAVAAGDEKTLMQVPGIGRKGAQRLLLELSGRLGPPTAVAAAGGAPAGTSAAGPAGSGWRDQLHGALVGLGWSTRDADEALVAVAPEADGALAAGTAPDLAALLRTALRTLSRS